MSKKKDLVATICALHQQCATYEKHMDCQAATIRALHERRLRHEERLANQTATINSLYQDLEARVPLDPRPTTNIVNYPWPGGFGANFDRGEDMDRGESMTDEPTEAEKMAILTEVRAEDEEPNINKGDRRQEIIELYYLIYAAEPTEEEIFDFVQDEHIGAYGRMVTAMLAAPLAFAKGTEPTCEEDECFEGDCGTENCSGGTCEAS